VKKNCEDSGSKGPFEQQRAGNAEGGTRVGAGGGGDGKKLILLVTREKYITAGGEGIIKWDQETCW